ncbi:DUF1223 domain-containing protein [Aquimarina aquimarini]|uniref:DUF1223 domain-containing protein n=1 Tax=Aquimarina aquimarini TaxID=1191734 RepID=UPI00131EDA69|nr:DUF1223 domain-containing protein [Aquimarina aquimarini]
MLQKLMMVLTLIFWISSAAQQHNKPIILLELFTSQGCSSCPPADELLGEIKKNYKDQNVFVVSYHVDYWNRLGWKDPFSLPIFSEYQRAYAQRFESRSIYTPQLVVNGSEHFTGSDSYKLDKALKKYSKTKTEASILIKNIQREPSHVIFNYKVDKPSLDRISWVLVVDKRITKVARGENRSKTLINTNIAANGIVTKEQSAKVSISIPNWVSKNDQLSIIGYVQSNTMRVIGATKIEL